MEKNSNNIFVNTSFDIDILKIVIRRNWYWILLIAFLLLAAAFLYLRYTKPVYESKMLIQISNEDQGADVLDFKNLNDEISISREIELLRSEYLFEKALSKLDLKISYYAQGDVLTEKRYKQNNFYVENYVVKDSSILNKPIFISNSNGNIDISLSHDNQRYNWEVEPGKLLETPFFQLEINVPSIPSFAADLEANTLYFQFNGLESLTQRYLSDLEVKSVDVQAKTIEISYQNHNARLAQDITEAIGRAFFRYDEDFKKESAENVLNFISLQLDSLKRELNNSKDSIMNFQRRENLPDPENLSSSISNKLEKYRFDLYDLEEELRTLNLISRRLEQNPESLDVYKLIPELIGKSYEGSLNLQVKELHELLETKEDLSYKVTPENEMIKKIDSRIENRIVNINKIIDALKDRLNDKISVIKKEIRSNDDLYFELPKKEMELSRLKNIQNLNEKYYTLLTEKQVLYSISNAGYASSNKILNKASISNTPISPKRSLIYGAALFLSFAFGFALLFLRYLTFNEINQLPELQKLLPDNVSVLGSLPNVGHKMEHSKMLVNDSPKSMVSEAFRTIRTNLSFVKNNARTIAVTSSISGEGKTFVTLNLAGILAMSGKKVIVLDLDMRKPKIHEGFDALNDIGMSNLLVEQIKISETIKSSSLKNLDFITAGPIPPNPSELILGSAFKNILEELKDSYDVILIDNPPIGIVSDGVNVLAMVDLPIYVFKANYSKRFFVNKLKEVASLKEIKKLSIILNGVKLSKTNYGYGYGYYEDESKKSFLNQLKRK
ncbi:MAG: polysaccharide biosynthesis tyrosine autokinase [Brumimicrobium sp.]